jgi:CheY-like chemotaxis protein
MTGKDALLFIENLHSDPVLLDVMLDNGIDDRVICNEIKHSANWLKDVPVVMVSASHNLKDAPRCFCGPATFISQRFDITT